MRRLTASSEGVAGDPDGVLELPLALRERSRFCAHLRSGEEVAVVLERGTLLRGGARLVGEDGFSVDVVAAHEPLLRVTAETPHDLVRAAYHLGNRHVRLQIGRDFLHIEPDPVLAEMLAHLGFSVAPVSAPFEPEGGIYGYAQSAGHHHGHGHQHVHEHEHEHEHEHGHRHEHPHSHGHADPD